MYISAKLTITKGFSARKKHIENNAKKENERVCLLLVPLALTGGSKWQKRTKSETKNNTGKGMSEYGGGDVGMMMEK